MSPTDIPCMDAENTVQVFDGLWCSGQLSAADIARLPGLGIATVINLALPTSSNALPGEAERVTALGLNYVQIPVEWKRPQTTQFQLFVGVMAAFGARPVWLHCAKNMRASAFVYLYRKLIRGEPEEQALWPMRSIWTPNPVWLQWMASVCAAYGNAVR